jgi:elongation factor P
MKGRPGGKSILMHAETGMPLTAELPTTVDLDGDLYRASVAYDTATNTLKPATGGNWRP